MTDNDTSKPVDTGKDTPPAEDNPNVEIKSGKLLNIVKRG